MIEEIYFISGHRNITDDEFNNYIEKFKEIEFNWIDSINPDMWPPQYVVGDYKGVDIMAQNYLINELKINPDRITVYHMFDKPMNINSKIKNLVGGFKSDEERDTAMTNASHYDIAFVRDHLQLSGTAMNILRRKLLK